MYSVAGNTDFKIRNTKLRVPIVILTKYEKGNVKLTTQSGERFKKSVYWNQHKMELTTREVANNNPLKILLDASFQGVKRLFVSVFNNTVVNDDNNPINNTNNRVERDSHRKYFLPRVNATNNNVLIDGRNFY